MWFVPRQPSLGRECVKCFTGYSLGRAYRHTVGGLGESIWSHARHNIVDVYIGWYGSAQPGGHAEDRG